MSLSELAAGFSATVVTLSEDCQGLARRRLMDLGITPGTVVCAEMSNAGRSATAYRVRGALIALRREQADLIRIQPC